MLCCGGSCSARMRGSSVGAIDRFGRLVTQQDWDDLVNALVDAETSRDMAEAEADRLEAELELIKQAIGEQTEPGDRFEVVDAMSAFGRRVLCECCDPAVEFTVECVGPACKTGARALMAMPGKHDHHVFLDDDGKIEVLV